MFNQAKSQRRPLKRHTLLLASYHSLPGLNPRPIYERFLPQAMRNHHSTFHISSVVYFDNLNLLFAQANIFF